MFVAKPKERNESSSTHILGLFLAINLQLDQSGGSCNLFNSPMHLPFYASSRFSSVNFILSLFGNPSFSHLSILYQRYRQICNVCVKFVDTDNCVACRIDHLTNSCQWSLVLDDGIRIYNNNFFFLYMDRISYGYFSCCVLIRLLLVLC